VHILSAGIKADTNIYDVATGEIIDLSVHLECKAYIATEVFLGKETKLKVRIIASKLTPEQSIARRRKANKLAKSRGYTSSEKNQKLLDWSIFITNIRENKLSNEQVMTIYRTRWQIELLFKLYKSQMNIDKLASRFKAGRVLCEFYAKLCAILMFHGIVSCLELKKDIEISLTKAALGLKKRA
jgi:IS4 transposase